MPICDVCREGLEGIWDPSKTKRICTVDEWKQLGVPYNGDNGGELDRPENFIFGHHATQESFIRAMEEGCVICKDFDDYYKESEEADEKPKHEPLELRYYTVFHVVLKPTVTIKICLLQNYRHISHEMEPHNFDGRLRATVSPYTGDEDTWGIIRGWLDECLQEHTSCNQRDIAGYIPSRLIELNTATEPTFRIVRKAHVDSESRYLTLSHCWGPESAKPRLKLTESTSEWLSKDQPCRTLPKTFRDATEVAQRLGIRYIWIDSLCILQDSVEDWRVESSSMKDVYRNALLNIAALGASDNEGGLFCSRDPPKVQPTIVNLGINNPKDLGPYLSYKEPYVWIDSFFGEPLIKRGWVVQERVLPRRIVYFGSQQVFWECYETACSETHSKESHEHDRKKENAIIEPSYARKALINDELIRGGRGHGDHLSQLFSDWYYLLVTYTECKLTVPTDKLVALSGIAKDMRRRLAIVGYEDAKYLAGMWGQQLPQALTWELSGSGSRPIEYRSPSWSWAAVDGELQMEENNDSITTKVIVSVIRAETTPMNTEDDTGEIRDGALTLEGILITADLDSRTKKYPWGKFKRNITDFRNPQNDSPFSQDQEYDSIYTNEVRFDTEEDVLNQVLCLPIVEMKDEEVRYDSNSWSVKGLALIRLGDGNYRRVGIFEIGATREDIVRSILKRGTRGEVNIV